MRVWPVLCWLSSISPSLPPPPAEAATVPIQTCNTADYWGTGGGTVAIPPVTVNGTTSHLGSQQITVSRQVPVEGPNPNHDPNDPDSPATIITHYDTETKTKNVVAITGTTPYSLTFEFGNVSFSPPNPGSPGSSDLSSNLTTQQTNMVTRYSGASSTTTIDPDPLVPVTGPPGDFIYIDGKTTTSSSSVSVSSGTRKSDGTSTTSSPANYYDQGTIEAWNWSGSWGAGVSISSSFTYISYTAAPDTSWDGGSGSFVSSAVTVPINTGAGSGGGIGGCSRTLVVAPPNCKIDGTDSSPYGWVFHKTETFSSHGNHGRPTRVYDVGPNRRSQVTLANFHNPFSLRSGDPTFSYDNGLQGKSTNVASVMQSHMNGAVYPFYFTIANEGIGAAYSAVPQHSHPSTNAINTPGRYRVTWIPKWKTAANSLDGIWNGSELSSETCKYDGTPADPLEGAQSHPAQNALVTRLGLNIWVHAEPPTCSVDEFLFEVNDPPTSRITLFNPNRAPMDVGRSELTISRGGYSQTNSAGSHVIAAASMDGLGNVLAAGEEIIDAAGDAIDFSGQFTALWSLESNMGAETWTTLFTPRPPQNSWFQDPDERIVTGGGLECASSGNRIVYLPFIKVFYGGLAAGGQFGTGSSYTSCGQGFEDALGGDRTVAAFVAGHAEVVGGGDVRGSSVEYALQANNIIGGFYSASQRSSDPRPLKGLTLSNNDNLHAYGGSFGRQACIAHYWREVEKLELSAKPSPLTLDLKTELDANERRRYELLAGEKLELSVSGALDGLKATLYVEGDVLISENIIQNGGPWYDPSEIGYLSIIVKGNIDIAPNVDRIDAVLVAYPQLDAADNVVDGRIRTCWHPDLIDPASPDNIHFHTCDKQLVINGALIAEKVLFGRVHASVKQETSYPAAPPRATNPTNPGSISNYVPHALRSLPAVPNYVLPDCSDILNGNLGISWSLPSSHPDYPNPLGYSYSLQYIHYIPYPGYTPLNSNTWNRSGSVYSDNIDFNDLPGPGYYLINISTLRGSIGNTTPGDPVAYGWLFCPVPFAAQPIHVSNFSYHPSWHSNVRPYSRINLRCDLRTGETFITVDGRAWDHYRIVYVNGIPAIQDWPNSEPYRYMVRVSGPAFRWRPDGYAENWYHPWRLHNQHLVTRIVWSPGVKGPFRITVSDYSESQLHGQARLGRLRGSITQTMICDDNGIGISVPVPPPGVIPPLVPVLQGTTAAAEIINLLPEYLIGTPELPLFGDQFYKTDSFSISPVNF